MGNPFKKILHQEKLPEKLRGKIMSDISFIKLTIDMADLLVIKYPEIVGNFLNLDEKNQKN